jgi:hypothetical protein
MTLLPIVARELRIRARWRSTWLVRTGVAVVALAVTVVMSFSLAFGATGAGQGMLMTLGWITFVFCVVEGFRSTADCISEEKREGTLGLLFLTDLKGYDVVLGKFVATSLSSVYGLLAVIPALAVPVLLGGVTGAEFWRVVLALVSALWLSLTSGIFISTITRDERKAWAGTVGFAMLTAVGFPILGSLPGLDAFKWFSPATAMINAFEPAYTTTSSLYWQPLGINSLLGLVLIATATFLLPRVWQDAPARRCPRTKDSSKPKSPVPVANPMRWLAARNQHQRRWLWMTVCISVGLGVSVWAISPADPMAAWVAFGIGIATQFVLSVWVASEACYSFADARSSGALELLLSTPLTVRQIVRGQQMAIYDLFFGPVLLLVVAEVFVLAFHIALQTARGGAGYTPLVLLVMVAFFIASFLLDLLAVSRVGMWFSLTSSKATAALSKTVLFVLVLPLLMLPCCMPVSAGLLLAKSFIFFTWAQGKLESEFRKAATKRFDAPRSDWWKRRGPPPLVMPR